MSIGLYCDMKVNWAECPLIEVDPERQSGKPVFKGTRIPIDVVLNNIPDGGTEDEIREILENFDVTRSQVDALLAIVQESNPQQLARV